MPSEDEVHPIDIYCDEAEANGRKASMSKCISLRRSLGKDPKINAQTVTKYQFMCIAADRYLTQEEHRLLSELTGMSDDEMTESMEELTDKTTWKEAFAEIRKEFSRYSNKVRKDLLMLGVLTGASDGRVTESERKFLIELFGDVQF